MRLYNQEQQKLGWEDPKTFNVKTQAQADANQLGVREGIALGRSCKFALDGLDAY
jgi:hypothetical protein